VRLQPSSKTSYVVLGSEPGASKLTAIKKHGLKSVDEDGLLDLIGSRDGVMDEKTKKKMQEEEEKAKTAAVEIELRERRAAKQAAKDGNGKAMFVIMHQYMPDKADVEALVI
jgi:replication factor C subunit 1